MKARTTLKRRPSALSWVRLLIPLVAVFGTYNTSGYSLYELVRSDSPASIKVVLGVALIILWAIALRATWRSLGAGGLGLLVLLAGSLLWVVHDLLNVRVIGFTLMQCVVVVMLFVGMQWSIIRRRITGQMDVDDVSIE